MFADRNAARRTRHVRRRLLEVDTLERRTVPAAQIGQNFAGPSSNDSPYVPPDTDGAVGATYFASMVNGRFKVYQKASPHTVTTNIGDDTFWLNANSSLAGVVNTGVSDPRIIYDPLSDRWFASEITINNTGAVGNSVLIARSDTNDPNGTWKAAGFIPNGSLFADYDTLGVDANAIYIGTDNFPSSGGATSITVVTVPKAQFLNNADVSLRKVVTQPFNQSNFGWTPQPVTNFNASPTHGSIIGVNVDGTASPSHVFRTTITWSSGNPGNPTFNPVTTFNPQATYLPDPAGPVQPDGVTALDPIDDRFGAVTYQVGDLIYAVHIISVNSAGVGSNYNTNTTTDGVRLTIFSDAQNSIVGEATWFNTSFNYLDPSICANAAGDFVIGFTRVGPSSPSGRAGSYAVPGRIDPANPAGGITLGSELQLKAGLTDSYQIQGLGNQQRWGDFSATNIDPSNQTSFWTMQEYAAGTNSWGTQITQVFVSPRVSGVSSTIANGTYNVGTVIPITVTFNDAVVVNTAGGTPTLSLNAGTGAVATYVGGTGTNTLTFNYTVAPGQSSADLDYTSTTALNLNGGTIKDQASSLDVITTLANPGAVGSLGNSKSIVIDTTPKVGNVTSPAADGTYGLGATIPITVTFTSPVVVTGTPKLALNAGASAVANYVSGSGTATLTFNYVVTAGQSSPDLDYTSTTALTLNGGTIKDQVSGVNAILTLAAPGTPGSLGFNKNIVINATGAAASSVSSTNPDGTYGFNATIAVTVTFSKPVTVTGTPKLALNSSGTAAATYSSIDATNTVLTFNYIVAAGDFSAHLDYTSTTALTLNGGTIKDQSTGQDASLILPSPGAAGSLGANKNIVIDALPAKVNNVTSPTADGTYDTGATILVTVTFDKPVNVTGSPKLALNSSATAAATYSSGTGSANLTFVYTVAFADFSTDLDYTSTTALTLNGGTITDQATGVNAGLTLATPETAGSLGFNKNIVIDARPARPMNITSPVPNGTYGINQTIPITITFSKQVSVTGTPQLALNSSGTAVATFASIDPAGTTLTFNYTVQGGDSSPDLDYTSVNSLSGGAITDVGSGTAAIEALPAPGTAGSLGANKNLVIDAIGPNVVAFKVLFGSKSYDLLTSSRIDVPWRITGVQAVFAEPIYSGNRLSLSGLTARRLTGLGTTTLTWTFLGVQKGTFNATLSNTGPNALKDLAGNPIAAFSKIFKVLYGDFNDDQTVDAADEAGVRANLSAPYDLHPSNYNIFADLSGDGLVNVIDVGIAHNRRGQTLP
jgi:hypothetical protein